MVVVFSSYETEVNGADCADVTLLLSRLVRVGATGRCTLDDHFTVISHSQTIVSLWFSCMFILQSTQEKPSVLAAEEPPS